MISRGCCYDNAVMERFFWSLKYEWTNHERFANLEETKGEKGEKEGEKGSDQAAGR
jgi:transposase InsO family protein